MLAGQKESGEEAEAAPTPESPPENAPEQTAAPPPAKGRPRTSQITATRVLPPDEGSPRPALDLRMDDFAESDGRNQRAAQADHAVMLAPLTEAEATSGLFTERPKLNELLSVMKLTWKLVRRHKQEKP